MPQARITINDTQDRVRNGHPWVFGTQIVREEGAYEPGDVVLVLDGRQRPLGQGYINPASMIRVRMLTTHKEERVSSAFIRARIRQAWERRRRLGYAGSCRVIFGEADLLPGLVVDLFHDVERDHRILSMQFLTLGMERWRDVVVEALRETIVPAGMYLRNDVPVREKEGLAQEKAFIGKGFATDLVIEEKAFHGVGVRMHVDVADGQKTGHFLDQVLNHVAVGDVVRRASATGASLRVLDCFTHTGGFGLHAAMGGASDVLGLDLSADAVAMATRNAGLNALSNCTFQEANVFDFLTEASRSGRQWVMR